MRKIMMALILIISLISSSVTAFAAPAAVLVNPAPSSIVYSSNLLISVKLMQPTTIKVQVFEERQMVNGTSSAVNIDTLSLNSGEISNSNSFTSVSVMPEVTFNSTNNLSFYTKQVNGLTPGLYKIQIRVVDANGKVTDTITRHVAIKQKTEDEAKIFDTPQSGTMQFLQNLLKTIFGN